MFILERMEVGSEDLVERREEEKRLKKLETLLKMEGYRSDLHMNLLPKLI